ncbi:SDR family NAD(P)-dependent oxidoreductase [Congregibacter variabilis]|uniref:SDR family NAD(P)-dependent oxidoreductase n=1 Tax=Congregibacter variabilis TaxID=3081200 RepID=A0ABZ0I8G6_9GAMM|nr:SDR family NAD(P)-dependent oxidoreductase [Congregibacter sp. IMCC43200]
MPTLFSRLIGMLLVTISLASVAQNPEPQKSILITGATTGIGRNLAESLAKEGHHVYAGARTDAEMAELNTIDNITALRLDVTKQDQVDEAVQYIQERGTGLYALVNNAGIYDGGAVLDTELDVLNLVYQVNVEGVLRTTKAFAPLVIESRGRIATTGSIAGTVSGPGFAAYSGSKHYIEAFTDSLAAELEPLGVSVSVIEPGNYQTHIRRSAVKRSMARVVGGGGIVTSDMEKQYKAMEEVELSYKKPNEVTLAYKHALFADAPLRRYVVVPNAEEQQLTIETKIRELVQLNSWGPHSYDNQELVEKLKSALGL